MDYVKKVYTWNDMEELDLESAPSIGLSALEVVGFRRAKYGTPYMLYLAKLKRSYKDQCVCPYCKEPTKLTFEGDVPTRHIHDVPHGNYRIDIGLVPYKVKCLKCERKFTPAIPGIIEHAQMTERLKKYIRDECLLQPYSTLAARCGISDEKVRNIAEEVINEMDADRIAHPIQAPRVLGIDEKHIQKKMRGIITDNESHTLLDMLPDNKEMTMKDGISRLKGWDTDIKVVTTDMANSYLRWLPSFLPNATVVIDHFHVSQDVNKKVNTTKKALYQYRKELIGNIEDEEERLRQRSILRFVDKNRRLFNYSMRRLMSEKDPSKLQMREAVMAEFPEFRLLHNLSYTIEYMYTRQTREEAEAVWDEWVNMLPPVGKKEYQEWCDLYSVDEGCFDAFQSFSRNEFQRYKPFILNYFNPGCQETNGPTEGRNGDIQRINAIGTGYSFKHLRARALYASNIHERIIYTFDVKSIPKSAWKQDAPVMGFMTYHDTNSLFGGSNYNSGKSRRTITKYVLGHHTVPFSLPKPNMINGSDWLLRTSSAEYSDKADSEYYRMLALNAERQRRRVEYPSAPVVVIDNEPEFIEAMWEYMEPDVTKRINAEFLDNPNGYM